MKLSDLDHLRNDKRIRFNQETVNGETVTIVSYMVADPSLWLIPLATECRGLVFNEQGDCISRPLKKFFNLNENESTQKHHLDGKTFEVLEKRDGSMLVPVLVGGQIAWKTKKSFYSDVAIEASKCVPDAVAEFAMICTALDYTPIWEFCSPNNRIVLDYGSEPSFTLVAMRDNITGKYESYEYMQSAAKTYGFPLIQRYNTTLDDCLAQVSTLENFEGWCLRDVETGFYVKVKTEWYLRNHRSRTELRERDVADMVIEETLDDIKSALALDGFDLSPIEEIERNVVSELSMTRTVVEHVVDNIECKTDFKAIAEYYKGSKLFGLIMTLARGKEPDYKKYWKQHYRDNYSLKCVYNKNF